MRTVFISHGRVSGGGSDLDAVASVACGVRAFRRAGFVDVDYDLVDYIPERLDRLVAREDRDARLVLADIPLEALCRVYEPEGSVAEVLETLHERGNRIVLIDHHPIPESDRDLYRDLESRGVVEELRLVLPPEKRPATGMVADYLQECGMGDPDPVRETLVRYAIDQDFATRSIPEANRLTDIIVGRHDLASLVEMLVKGVFWDEGMETFLRQAEEATRQLCSSMVVEHRTLDHEDFPVAYAWVPEELKTTPASEYLFEMFPEIAVAALFKRERISLRRRLGIDQPDLGTFAFENGGGGHPGASVLHGNRCELFDLAQMNPQNFGSYVDRLHAALDRHAGAASPEVASEEKSD